jgi:hypothetical protein
MAPVQNRMTELLPDDAHYYFTIARSLARFGRLTFDGQSIANGFHPL